MFKELFTEGQELNAEVIAFNKELEDLTKKKKIAGKEVKYTQEKISPALLKALPNTTPHTGELNFSYGGKDWKVEFASWDIYNGKISYEIQIVPNGSRGGIYKKVSGRNATPEAIWKKLDKFFITQKW